MVLCKEQNLYIFIILPQIFIILPINPFILILKQPKGDVIQG